MFLRKFVNTAVWNGISNRLNHSKTLTPVQVVLEKWKNRFETEKVPEVGQSINNILAHVLGKRKLTAGEIEKDITLNLEQIAKFENLCECRVARMPIQYIIGQWEFCDLTLKMTPPVFIPRPETEELVELILQQVDMNKSIKFLEIGCGSGAISLALLKSLPKTISYAIDQSKLACDLTKQNAQMLKLENRLHIFQEKLTPDNQLVDIKQTFELIVSNPPYIRTGNIPKLQPEIKLYEDLRALDGGEDGLTVIKSILHVASSKLKPNGHLWLEIDPGQPKLIEDYIKTNVGTLKLKFVASYQDLFQKERFVEIIKN